MVLHVINPCFARHLCYNGQFKRLNPLTSDCLLFVFNFWFGNDIVVINYNLLAQSYMILLSSCPVFMIQQILEACQVPTCLGFSSWELARAKNPTTIYWQKLETLQQSGGKSQKSYKNLTPTARNNHHGKIIIAWLNSISPSLFARKIIWKKPFSQLDSNPFQLVARLTPQGLKQ